MIRGSGALAIAAVTAAVAGCGGDADPCADLSGLWRADDGRRYHVVDQAGAVEVFALADSRGDLDRPMPGAPRSASYARLRPTRPGELAGHGQQFRTRGARACRVRWPVTATCGQTLALQLSDPGDVDFADCGQGPPGAGRALVLRRLR